MKILLSIFILLFAFSGFGQVKRKTAKPKPLPKCEIKAEQLPLVRGLKLGVSAKYVTALYPTAKFEEPEFSVFQGEFVAHIEKSEINNANLSRGIESLTIALNDNKVVHFSVYYDDKIMWFSGKEFALKMSDYLSIPFEFWENDKKNIHTYRASCADFSIFTDFKESKPSLSVFEGIERSIERINEKKKNFQP